MSKRSMYKNNLVIGLALIFQSCGYQTSTLKSQLDESNYSLRPIPEYEDSSYVVISGGLDVSLIDKFQEYLPKQGVKLISIGKKPQKEDINTISIPMEKAFLSPNMWARDWGAISVKENDNVSQVAFTYEGASRSKDAAFLAADAISMDIKRPKLKLSSGDEYDFIFEGGNFMSDGEDCVMTDKPVRDMILTLYGEEILSQSSGLAQSQRLAMIQKVIESKINSSEGIQIKEDVKKYFREELGCKRTIMTDKTPHEGTNHIDLWAKFIDKKTVLVHYIPDERFNQVLPMLTSSRRRKLTDIKSYLDNNIRKFENLGYKVIPVKMATPLFATVKAYISDTESYNVDTTEWLSTLNMLFVVNGQSKVAYIPDYREATDIEIDFVNTSERVYTDLELFPKYKGELTRILESYGFQSFYLDTDALVGTGGSIHCVTMQIP